MNTLQFIDSMTGRLAWPLAVIILGLVFRRSLVRLLGRVRKLRWGETEAELEQLAEASQDMRDAVAEAAKPLPADAEESSRENRERIERLMRDAARWGFRIGKVATTDTLPSVRIVWDNDQPRLLADGPMRLGPIIDFPGPLGKGFGPGSDPLDEYLRGELERLRGRIPSRKREGE